MSVLLAAIDDSAAARPVLTFAQRFAQKIGATVVAVHVSEDGSGATAQAVADAVGVPLRLRRGNPAEVLATLARTAEVEALVVGARRVPAGATPAGHVVLDLFGRVRRPVVVVPPDSADRPLRRLLVPLDEDPATVDAIRALVGRVVRHDSLDVIALHVFEPDDLPPFADSPALEADAWEYEFMRRLTPPDVPAAVRLEVRVGAADSTVPASAAELDADLVAVGWRRDLSGGHARVVRALLAGGRVPVLLVPVRVGAGVIA